MLKKSDILALLDRLPDEFEDDEFQSALSAISQDAAIPAWQIEAAKDAAKDVRENGGLSEAEFKEEIRSWVASNT